MKEKNKKIYRKRKKCGIIYITRGYIAKKERRKYVKLIYRMLPIFIIIVFVFLVFFVEECIRLEINLYDKPLVKLKIQEIKSNNKNIYIDEIHSLGFSVRYEYDLNKMSEDLVQYTISKKTFKTSSPLPLFE